MSDTVIKIDNLGKQYRLGQIGTGALSHDINRLWYLLRGKEDPYLKVGEVNDRSVKGTSDWVWALKDVSFDVKRGEALGIIGKNGAGKSTLLKILSQITSPTTGEIKIKGRVAALLEVGTGFHPELTGRENVFLNGAILGMTKFEIKSKLDEIVNFSGVEKYIDTPVKRYSSGMVVRLGFAVAAHLDPEILIVDEVLAVGDADFQKRCIGKMRDVNGEGRTVLFVSHNMASVKSLCSRGVVLTNGNVSFMGNIDESVNKYLKEGSIDGNSTEYKVLENQKEANSPEADLISIGIKAVGKEYSDPMRMDEDLELVIKFNKKDAACLINLTVQIKDSNGNFLFASNSGDGDGLMIEQNLNKTGIFEYAVLLPKNFFNAQTFYANLLIVKNKKDVLVRISDVISFNIIPKEKELGSWMGISPIPLRPLFKWRLANT